MIGLEWHYNYFNGDGVQVRVLIFLASAVVPLGAGARAAAQRCRLPPVPTAVGSLGAAFAISSPSPGAGAPPLCPQEQVGPVTAEKVHAVWAPERELLGLERYVLLRAPGSNSLCAGSLPRAN